MNKVSRNKLRVQRKRRIRARVSGTAEIPRMAIFRSLKGIQIQVIDDTKGVTLVSATTQEAKSKHTTSGAKKVGELAAKKCVAKKIEKVVFDRGGYKYHGKVKALAEGAREGGLKF